MSSEWKKAMIIGICGVIGMIFAIMIQMMVADEIIINNLISSDVPLRAVQAFIIIFWTGIGVFFASVSK